MPGSILNGDSAAFTVAKAAKSRSPYKRQYRHILPILLSGVHPCNRCADTPKRLTEPDSPRRDQQPEVETQAPGAALQEVSNASLYAFFHRSVGERSSDADRRTARDACTVAFHPPRFTRPGNHSISPPRNITGGRGTKGITYRDVSQALPASRSRGIIAVFNRVDTFRPESVRRLVCVAALFGIRICRTPGPEPPDYTSGGQDGIRQPESAVGVRRPSATQWKRWSRMVSRHRPSTADRRYEGDSRRIPGWHLRQCSRSTCDTGDRENGVGNARSHSVQFGRRSRDSNTRRIPEAASRLSRCRMAEPARCECAGILGGCLRLPLDVWLSEPGLVRSKDRSGKRSLVVAAFAGANLSDPRIEGTGISRRLGKFLDAEGEASHLSSTQRQDPPTHRPVQRDRFGTRIPEPKEQTRLLRQFQRDQGSCRHRQSNNAQRSNNAKPQKGMHAFLGRGRIREPHVNSTWSFAGKPKRLTAFNDH